MREDGLEASRLVGIVAKGAGAFVGTAAAAGKRIRRCVRDMLAVEEGPSKPAVKEPVQAPAKRKRKAPQPRSGAARPKAVRAKAQKKTAKRKRSNRPETSAARKQA